MPEEYAGKPEFFERVLSELDIEIEYASNSLANIPTKDPLVFIANHPFGLLDGMVLAKLAATARPNWGILVNSAMDKFDDFAEQMLPISFEETREANRLNIKTKKRALKILSEDGAIVIFPAGGVMTAEGFFGPVTGLEWKLFTAKMIQQSDATVVPAYFHGRNSWKFQIASQISYTVRAALFIHELVNKSRRPQKVSIGKPIFPEDYAHLKKKQAVTDFLRQSVYDLGPDNIVKVRQRKDSLDVTIGQSAEEIWQERRDKHKERRRARIQSIRSGQY